MRKVCQSCADCVPIACRVKVHRTLRGRLRTFGTRQHTPRLAAIHATRRRCGGVFQEEKRMMKAPERLQMHLAAHTQTTSPAPTRPARLLRLSEVEMRCTLKKSAIYAAIAAKTFPAPVRLGNRCVAWHEAEIDGWIASRSRVKGVQ